MQRHSLRSKGTGRPEKLAVAARGRSRRAAGELFCEAGSGFVAVDGLDDLVEKERVVRGDGWGRSSRSGMVSGIVMAYVEGRDDRMSSLPSR